MSAEERLYQVENTMTRLTADVAEIKGELRWIRFIMLGLFVQMLGMFAVVLLRGLPG